MRRAATWKWGRIFWWCIATQVVLLILGWYTIHSWAFGASMYAAGRYWQLQDMGIRSLEFVKRGDE